MAGLAPSTSSTRFCRSLQKTRMGLCSRSYVLPSQAMVSQRPLINKVEDYEKIWFLTSVASWHRYVSCFFFFFRIWQSGSCTNFPDTDGAFRVLPVLPAGWRLGLTHHHQHGTDETSVRQQNKPQHDAAVEFLTTTCFVKEPLWHPCLKLCNSAMCKVVKWL